MDRDADGSNASDAAFPKETERAPEEVKWWRISRGSFGFEVGSRNDAGLWSSDGGCTDCLSKMANIFNLRETKRTIWNWEFGELMEEKSDFKEIFKEGVFGVENKVADVASLSKLGLFGL